ncbi:hypothetical protein [Paenibacillus kobensis]|uniref:hypothetical protein n=1 Tax=Paenibacillus kobensis TaxID=59841 RepID=UPI000FDA110A|nr:hypothetical protein [Paenibacillus kobensis]
MLIVSTFEHTLQLELALAELEQIGISKESLLVVAMDPFDKTTTSPAHQAEDLKVRGFEVGMAVATGVGVIGASIGFQFQWGPIVWGLIYALAGFLIGYGAVWLIRVRKGGRPATRSPRRPQPELAVIVHCSESRSEEVRHILWHYRAISVGIAAEPASS